MSRFVEDDTALGVISERGSNGRADDLTECSWCVDEEA